MNTMDILIIILVVNILLLCFGGWRHEQKLNKLEEKIEELKREMILDKLI